MRNARLSAKQTGVAQALSGYRPTVSGNASTGTPRLIRKAISSSSKSSSLIADSDPQGSSVGLRSLAVAT
jgi:hypothetical protein